LVGVDDSSEVSAGHHVSVEGVSALDGRLLGVGSEDGVKGGEGILGEDNESSNVSTWGQLEEVESLDVADIDTWEVSGNLSHLLVLVTENNEWALLEDVLGVSVLSFSSSLLSFLSHSLEIGTGSQVLEGGEESLGGVNVEVVGDEGEFWDVLNSVTSGHDEWWAGRSSESGGDGVSSLVGVDLSVPLSPDLEWSEHSSLSAHVTEGSLSRSGSTGSRNSWNSSDSSSSSPGLSGVLLSLEVEDSLSLSSVLGHLGVDEVNQVLSDWGREDGWHVNLFEGFVRGVSGPYGNDWSSGHVEVTI
jgi:hypothetical protein